MEVNINWFPLSSNLVNVWEDPSIVIVKSLALKSFKLSVDINLSNDNTIFLSSFESIATLWISGSFVSLYIIDIPPPSPNVIDKLSATIVSPKVNSDIPLIGGDTVIFSPSLVTLRLMVSFVLSVSTMFISIVWFTVTGILTTFSWLAKSFNNVASTNAEILSAAFFESSCSALPVVSVSSFPVDCL